MCLEFLITNLTAFLTKFNCTNSNRPSSIKITPHSPNRNLNLILGLNLNLFFCNFILLSFLKIKKPFL